MSGNAPANNTSRATANLIAGLKVVAAFTAAKTNEAIKHLQAPPTNVTCSKCDSSVGVPEQLFNWTCAACRNINHWSAENCTSCQSVRASAPAPTQLPTVMCSRCGQINEVPLSNARKHAGTAVKVTKELASKTAEFAKEQYAVASAIPIMFHCEHCNEMMPNPNSEENPPDYNAVADEKTGDTGRPKLYKVICPQCLKETTIPSTVAADKVRSGAFLVARGTVKIYYSAADMAHVDCPKCSTAVKLHQDQAAVADQKNLHAYVEDLGGGTYSVKCPKCGEEFAAAIPLKK
jgi:hypothetical protein